MIVCLSFLLSGCIPSNADLLDSCTENISCIVPGEKLLENVETYNCHKTICSGRNLSVFMKEISSHCDACFFHLSFMDGGGAQANMSQIVKCFSEETNKVETLKFDNILNECR